MNLSYILTLFIQSILCNAAKNTRLSGYYKFRQSNIFLIYTQSRSLQFHINFSGVQPKKMLFRLLIILLSLYLSYFVTLFVSRYVNYKISLINYEINPKDSDQSRNGQLKKMFRQTALNFTNHNQSHPVIKSLNELIEVPLIGQFFMQDKIYELAKSHNWQAVADEAQYFVMTPANKYNFAVWYHKAFAQCYLGQLDRCEESSKQLQLVASNKYHKYIATESLKKQYFNEQKRLKHPTSQDKSRTKKFRIDIVQPQPNTQSTSTNIAEKNTEQKQKINPQFTMEFHSGNFYKQNKAELLLQL